MNIRVFVSQFLFMLTLVACNVSNNESVNLRGENSITDETFTYSNKTNVLVKDTTGLNIFPLITTSSASYSIDPSLPNGLSIDATSGVISGTPSVAQTQTLYVITAQTPEGKEYAQITIEISDEPVKSLSYPANNLVFTKDTAGTSYTPTVVGGTPTSFSVNQTMPLGLSLNSTTGVISGTPTVVGASFYEITAANAEGESTIQILIDVQDIAPTGLSYTVTNNTSTVNTGTSMDLTASLTNSPGSVTYTISPNLPAGVTINATTGEISGVPTVDNGVTNYTVTVSNSAGSDTEDITLTINDPPTLANYSVTNQTLDAGTVVWQQNSPIIAMPLSTYAGGAGPTFACSPNPCAPGITVSSTGIISGTPTTLGTGSFHIDVTKDGTTIDSNTINYKVVQDYPENYNNMGYAATYTFNVNQIGAAALDVTPTPVAGGMPTRFKLADESYGTAGVNIYNLPINGLTIDYTDGSINGNPTGAADVTIVIEGQNLDSDGVTYVKTAEQSVRIIAQPIAPQNLGYDGASGAIANAAEYESITANSGVLELTEGVALAAAINPLPAGSGGTGDASGGTPDTYTITPSLPNGLSLNPTTGVISGKPTESTGIINYQITGTNDAGSMTETITLRTDYLAAPSALTYDHDASNTVHVHAPALLADNLRFEIFAYYEEPANLTGSSGSFTITPALPTGLYIHPNSGTIYGTPLATQTNTPHTVTFTNSLGTTSRIINIKVINNLAPSNLVYTNSSNTTPIILYEGDAVTNADILHSSDFDPANPSSTGGFINSYVETSGSPILAPANGSTPLGLTLDLTTGDITGTAIATDSRDQDSANIITAANNNLVITGTNDQGTSIATSTLVILEKPPVIEYSSTYGTNVILVKGDERTGAVSTADTYAQFFNVTNTGGLPATNVNGAALGATDGCYVASTSGGTTYPINAEYADYYDNDINNTNNGATSHTANTAFTFEQTNCSFKFNATTCFGTGETSNYTIKAKNSGTDYTISPVSIGLTVYKYDAPNYVFEPFGGATLATRLASTHIFYEDTYLNLDGVDESGGDAYGSYTPNIDDRCHQGSYNLTDSSDKPAALDFAASTGTFSVTDQMLMKKTSFTLSSSESLSGLNLSKTSTIDVQVSHVEATSSASDKLEVKKVDVNADGLMDVIIRNTECDVVACIDNNTSIYIQESSHVGYFDGVDGAATAITGTTGMKYVTGIKYATSKGGVLAITDDRDDFWAYSASDTDSLVADDDGSTNNDLTYPGYGIVPMESGTATRFGVVTLDTGNDQIYIEEYLINNERLIDFADGTNGISQAGTQIMQNAANGGIDVNTIYKVEYADIDGNGYNEAIIAYNENGTGYDKICLVANDGTTFQQTCMGEIIVPNGEMFRNMRFADVSGDSNLDIIVQSRNLTTQENSIYVHEYSTSFSGNFNTADILNLNSTSADISFDIADINGDGKADLITNNIDGDIDNDGTNEYANNMNSPRNIGMSIYYHSNASDIYQDALKATSDDIFYYHNSSGTTNQVEVIPHGSSNVLMNCSYQQGAAYANTSGGKTLADADIMSCGVIGTL